MRQKRGTNERQRQQENDQRQFQTMAGRRYAEEEDNRSIGEVVAKIKNGKNNDQEEGN